MAKKPQENILKNIETLDAIAAPLLRWFHSEKRALPWREEPTPYRVWVSEIMLQQTRVEAVKPYFERFVAALPDVRALARADEDTLMKLWEGLGYYSRARHLQSAARLICSDHGGEIPARFDDLLALPGIGRYTAGAVASIAFGERRPAVDGNVLRVIMRLLACPADILKESTKRAVEEALIAHLPENAGDFNQALMELGALVCLPRGAARCPSCPLERLCLAKEANLQAELPQKTPPKRRRTEKLTIFLLAKNGKIALEKRPAHGLLAGLWGFPAMEGHLKKNEAAKALQALGLIPAKLHALPAAQHIFSHITWQIVGWHVELAETSSDEPSAATKSSPASTEVVEANARPASLRLHEATAPYDTQTKTPPLLWATAQEIADIYSVPAAYRSYFPYLQAPDGTSS
ncbi:A/G-specific adenine glycosylase [uncultured Selenomonas sp.]|uniref:A/G-specific adenine glycosylase n=1 Tax=uncultured Selenomonas sp. TaxID=159275 RepID=UPI0028D115B6|nr:A/G-specific adenine glycosylase [uncultured Selenomonas sp.]